jgi:hypothetical protein
MKITKERAKEILNKYKEDKALFNWCEEYKQFVSDNVLFNNNAEVSYILNKSYEDNEAPLSYEDIENLYYTEEEIKEDEEHYLNELSKEEQEEYIQNRTEEQKEVLSWIAITDYLKYEFEQQKEVLLNNYWGRQTFGQAYSLDGCLIHAFLNKISRLI